MSNYKYNDLDQVRSDIKFAMPLNQFIQLADAKFTKETGIKCSPIEMVNEGLYKKNCDLDEHKIDKDGTRDSTASFTICPQKELFYCFGCGAGGDRFAYLSKRFNIDHLESVEMAAEIEGVDLSPYMVELTPEDRMRNELFNQNSYARDIAHESLLNNKKALDYLHGRGITDESIELFMLGYAPSLINGNNIFTGKIVNADILQLNKKKQFDDAILFPICDTTGRMRYFQSRPFDPLPGMKYIGGDDDHPLFDDTDRIFGFNIARKNLHKSGGRLVGVEGAPDTIACVQQGIVTCGFMGTTMNQHTFDLLDKYRVPELVLLLDGDKAGRDKTFKNAEKYVSSIKTDVKLKIALMPEGYDPEEFINAFGPDELYKAIDNAVYAVQYLIDAMWNDATTPTQKADFIFSIQKYMDALSNDIIKQLMITHIAGKVGMDPVQISDYYMQSAVKNAGAKLYSPDGEEIILGEAMRNPDFIPELITRFGDNDWYLLKHKHLFKILKSAEYTDIESLYTIVKNMNLDNIITYNWLERLHNNTGNVDFSLKDVEDKLIRRNALALIDSTKNKLNDMGSDVVVTIDRASTSLFDVMHHKSDESVINAKNQVDDVMAVIHERMSNPVDIIGDSYGPRFEKLSKYTLGSQDKDLIIIAANQSVGKTQLCENFIMYMVTELHIPTLWFTLEMDVPRMTFRNLAILSGIDCGAMMTGNITIEQKQMIDQCAINLRESGFYMTERGHDLSEAIATARKYVQSKHVKKIVIDYLQLQYITDRRTETRSRELGVISKAWKQFAKETNTTVILISQLGRQALDAETAEAEHGYGSYEVAQDADIYITLKDKTEDEIAQNGIEHGNKTMNLSKNRNGEKHVLIDIYSDGPSYRMMEC